MKRIFFLIVAIVFVTQLWAQNAAVTSDQSISNKDRNFRIPLIGEKAPSFTGESTNGKIKFPSDFGRNWKILFSHPQDFTPVCTTEILELATLDDQCTKLGIKLVVMSTDALDMHVQWKKSMESLNLNSKGAVKINFPLVDDNDRSISKKYGMIHSESNTTKTVRGVFIIDPENIIQAIYFYPTNVGRSTEELIRTVTALQATESGQVMTPVNWRAGNDLLIPIPPKTDDKGQPVSIDGFYSPIWYLWYKKGSQINN